VEWGTPWDIDTEDSGHGKHQPLVGESNWTATA
jgi:uracil-DNA glycosylase